MINVNRYDDTSHLPKSEVRNNFSKDINIFRFSVAFSFLDGVMAEKRRVNKIKYASSSSFMDRKLFTQQIVFEILSFIQASFMQEVKMLQKYSERC